MESTTIRKNHSTTVKIREKFTNDATTAISIVLTVIYGIMGWTIIDHWWRLAEYNTIIVFIQSFQS